MKTLYERTTFEHNGISLKVAIDYEKGSVSFLDHDNKPKRFLFADRGREHLGGWVKILEAMIEATKWADEKLKERDGQEVDKKLDEAVAWAGTGIKYPGLKYEDVVFGTGETRTRYGDLEYYENSKEERYFEET